MDYFYTYIIRNFILLAICLVMFIHAFQRIREHRRISICIIVIMSLTLAISVAEIMEEVARGYSSVMGATVSACLKYFLKPACIVAFIVLSGEDLRKKTFWICMLPLLYDFIIYLLPLFPATRTLVIYFVENDSGGISWAPGNMFLRYTSHIVAAFYLAYLIFRSVSKLRFKHYSHALTLFICAAVVVAAVLIETFVDGNGEIFVSNTAVAVSAVFYYLFLYIEQGRYDALTGLFNRRAYYADLRKMDDSISGVLQLDMNGLKYFNDKYGHKEGDRGLQAISEAILCAANYKMYAYRLGGDEFIVLAINDTEANLSKALNDIKLRLAGSPYSVSAGYAVRNEANQTFDDLYRAAETMMYQDKEAFYKNSPFERRKPDTID